MPFLYVILALILLVVVHELGHFLAARAVGIRATKFYVFFPPALFRRTVGDVEYGIGAIPAGGFVKLPGMFEPVPGEVAERLRWEFEDVMPLVRDGDLRLRLDAARRAVAHADGADDLLEPLTDARDALAATRAYWNAVPTAEALLLLQRVQAAAAESFAAHDDRDTAIEALRRDRDAVARVLEGDRRDAFERAWAQLQAATGVDETRTALEAIDDVLRPIAVDHVETDAAAAVRTIDKAHDRIVGLLDDAHPKAYWRAALWRRMTVIFAGPFVNLLVAFLVLTAFYWFLSPRFELQGPLRVDVEQGSPAAEAGLDDDSRIVGWNGPIEGLTPRQMEERIVDGRGEPATLVWTDGDGERRRATITPEPLDGAGSEPLIGVSAIRPTDVERVGREVTSLGVGADAAVAQMRFITVENLRRLPRVFFDSEIREDVGSVVGIVQFADEVDEAGQIIGYIAIISLILAVMNLLPLLPLDGGHLLFGLLEAVRRGRPMPRAAFERYSVVGMALVLMLFLIGLDNDISRARG